MKNEKLTELYRRWHEELGECAPELLGDDAYSNPHYIAIPESWDRAKVRIMIVGEEGYGERGCGKLEGWTMQKIREWTLSYLNVQLNEDKGHTDYNKSAFWSRLRKIKAEGTSFIWNNIDKIYSRVPEGGKYALSVPDRKRLHSTRTRVLREEIKITRPDIVVFFGWHEHSLLAELPDLYDLLHKEERLTTEGVGAHTIKLDQTIYIFTMHPNRKPKKYEDKVIAEIKMAIEAK